MADFQAAFLDYFSNTYFVFWDFCKLFLNSLFFQNWKYCYVSSVRNATGKCKNEQNILNSLPGHTTTSGIRLNIPSLSKKTSYKQWPEIQGKNKSHKDIKCWKQAIKKLFCACWFCLPWALKSLDSASCVYEILAFWRSWRNSSLATEGGISLIFMDVFKVKKKIPVYLFRNKEVTSEEHHFQICCRKSNSDHLASISLLANQLPFPLFYQLITLTQKSFGVVSGGDFRWMHRNNEQLKFIAKQTEMYVWYGS